MEAGLVGRLGEIEVAAGRKDGHPCETELHLVQVELEHAVLRLEPSDHHRRRTGAGRPHLNEREARCPEVVQVESRPAIV
jgi:hypothetical protein